jgi:hypothetical protein
MKVSGRMGLRPTGLSGAPLRFGRFAAASALWPLKLVGNRRGFFRHTRRRVPLILVVSMGSDNEVWRSRLASSKVLEATGHYTPPIPCAKHAGRVLCTFILLVASPFIANAP